MAGKYLFPFALVTTLFALWGFANDVTNPLVKAFKDIFVISNAQSSLVQTAFYGGYATMALPAALFIRRFSYKAGIIDFERGREDRLVPYPWFTDTTIGQWFHQDAAKFKSPNELVDIFVDIVSKNGCMLLNAGPRADGTFPAEVSRVLIALGDWLKLNGEAIYSTRPWQLFGEGPTRQVKGGGFSERAETTIGIEPWDKAVVLKPADTRFAADSLRQETKAGREVITGWTEEPTPVTWALHYREAGTHGVSVRINALDGPVWFVVKFHETELRGTAPKAAGPGEFVTVGLGRVAVPGGVPLELVLRPLSPTYWHGVSIDAVLLNDVN